MRSTHASQAWHLLKVVVEVNHRVDVAAQEHRNKAVLDTKEIHEGAIRVTTEVLEEDDKRLTKEEEALQE